MLADTVGESVGVDALYPSLENGGHGVPPHRELQDDGISPELFVHEYHRVELTEAGKVYLSQVKRILEQVETAKQQAADAARGRTGHLRIGHGTHLPDGYLSRVIAASQQTAPDVALDLLEAPTPRVLQALRQKSVDVGFVLTPSERTGLVVKHLLREPLVIVVPMDHRYARTPLIDLAQLAEENFVLCRRYEEPGYRELVEGIWRKAGFLPRVLQAVEHKKTVLDLVAEGLGVSIIQASTVTERLESVRFLPFPKSTPSIETAIAWRDDARHDAIARFVSAAEREAAVLNAAPLMPAPADAVRVEAVRV
jgi:DNA-binding transcriptional LysR family regulator